jgi:hypothetical protein
MLFGGELPNANVTQGFFVHRVTNGGTRMPSMNNAIPLEMVKARGADKVWIVNLSTYHLRKGYIVTFFRVGLPQITREFDRLSHDICLEYDFLVQR